MKNLTTTIGQLLMAIFPAIVIAVIIFAFANKTYAQTQIITVDKISTMMGTKKLSYNEFIDADGSTSSYFMIDFKDGKYPSLNIRENYVFSGEELEMFKSSLNDLINKNTGTSYTLNNDASLYVSKSSISINVWVHAAYISKGEAKKFLAFIEKNSK